MERTHYTVKEWQEKARELFGPDPESWAFKCPRCGHVQTGNDFIAAGLEPHSAYQECIGRKQGAPGLIKGGAGPCNWAAYGLFKITGTSVVITPDGKEVHVFDFADPAEVEEVAA